MAVWASGHRSTVTFRLESGALKQLNLCQTPASAYTPLPLLDVSWLAYYTQLFPLQPVRQNMPFDSRLRPALQPLKCRGVHGSAPEVAFALHCSGFSSRNKDLHLNRICSFCFSLPIVHCRCCLLVTVTAAGFD